MVAGIRPVLLDLKKHLMESDSVIGVLVWAYSLPVRDIRTFNIRALIRTLGSGRAGRKASDGRSDRAKQMRGGDADA